MKKNIILIIIVTGFSLKTFCQWNNHHYFNIGNSSQYTKVSFGDAIFTSSDTGYYCYYSQFNPPTPHPVLNTVLEKTTNDCKSWNLEYYSGCDGFGRILAIKYFKPYIFYLADYNSSLSILCKTENSEWNYLSRPSGGVIFYDFFAQNSSNYKILYQQYKGKFCQSFFEDGIEIRKDTFEIYRPKKFSYPVDSVGILLSSPDSLTEHNTMVLKYTLSTGYNIVYQDTNQRLTSIFFPSSNVGYVTCYSGMILRTDDLGDNWTELNVGHRLNSIFFINDSTGYGVGYSGLILKTIDYGLTWQQQASPTSLHFNKVFFVNDSVGFILSGQNLYKTKTGGATWIKEPIPESNFEVYPNPTTDKIYIRAVNENMLEVSLYSIEGRLLQHVRSAEIDLSDYATGIYFLRAGDKTIKILKK